MKDLEILVRVTECLSKLPGVGRRSAERMALRLARDSKGLVDGLIDSLTEMRDKVRFCSQCGGLSHMDQDPCLICSDDTRRAVLCVVEEPSDILSIERSGEFNGYYHVLAGRISPMRGEGPDDIRLKELVARIESQKIEEVILALNTDVEGEATTSLIIRILASRDVEITRLASGIPAGSGIVYSDPVTLARALSGRRKV